MFGRAALIPSFSFVDPFGYKGITQSLLKGMLKDWGCDLILFFSYARINAAIDNEIFEEHISALFGEDRLKDLRARLQGKRPWEREALILETFSQVLRDLGFKYVLPFTFQRKGQDRTSHHLILVTKHPLGYTVMKEIMAGESSEYDQGVPSFAYSRSLGEAETPLLFSLDRPLELLADDLLEQFEGQSLTMKEVFERHHLGTRYVERNYKTALGRLEVEGKIIASPPAIKQTETQWRKNIRTQCKSSFPAKKEKLMASNSRIEWTEATWNPIAGCKVISPGCTNCYAMRMASRLAAMGQKKYQGTTRKSGGRSKWNGEIRLDFSALDLPRRWTKGKLIFVNSMSDLFHDDVPLPFIKKVFQTMNETPHHTYQVLTKRADRVRDLSSQIEWTPNIWMGVSVKTPIISGELIVFNKPVRARNS